MRKKIENRIMIDKISKKLPSMTRCSARLIANSSSLSNSFFSFLDKCVLILVFLLLSASFSSTSIVSFVVSLEVAVKGPVPQGLKSCSHPGSSALISSLISCSSCASEFSDASRFLAFLTTGFTDSEESS